MIILRTLSCNHEHVIDFFLLKNHQVSTPISLTYNCSYFLLAPATPLGLPNAVPAQMMVKRRSPPAPSPPKKQNQLGSFRWSCPRQRSDRYFQGFILLLHFKMRRTEIPALLPSIKGVFLTVKLPGWVGWVLGTPARADVAQVGRQPADPPGEDDRMREMLATILGCCWNFRAFILFYFSRASAR